MFELRDMWPPFLQVEVEKKDSDEEPMEMAVEKQEEAGAEADSEAKTSSPLLSEKMSEDLRPMDTDKESLAEAKSLEECLQEDSGSDVAPMQTDEQLKQVGPGGLFSIHFSFHRSFLKSIAAYKQCSRRRGSRSKSISVVRVTEWWFHQAQCKITSQLPGIVWCHLICAMLLKHNAWARLSPVRAALTHPSPPPQEVFVPGPGEKVLFMVEPLSLEDLSLLAEMFYLPYEHGPKAMLMLKEFNWLRANSNSVSVNCKGEEPDKVGGREDGRRVGIDRQEDRDGKGREKGGIDR